MKFRKVIAESREAEGFAQRSKSNIDQGWEARQHSMDIRPELEQCIQWAREAGFSQPQQYDLKPHHYGIMMRKE